MLDAGQMKSTSGGSTHDPVSAIQNPVSVRIKILPLELLAEFITQDLFLKDRNQFSLDRNAVQPKSAIQNPKSKILWLRCDQEMLDISRVEILQGN